MMVMAVSSGQHDRNRKKERKEKAESREKEDKVDQIKGTMIVAYGAF